MTADCVHIQIRCVLMDVGVRELKQHLSEYLARAARGEIIRITERGVPKVQLMPLPGLGRLGQGVEEGWVRPAVAGRALVAVGRFDAERAVLEVLAEDRGE